MVTNLEYLLAVNAAAGRLLGDRASHPVVPWVSDLSQRVAGTEARAERYEGWRDLTMTKFRLKKGDAQVRQAYLFWSNTTELGKRFVSYFMLGSGINWGLLRKNGVPILVLES